MYTHQYRKSVFAHIYQRITYDSYREFNMKQNGTRGSFTRYPKICFHGKHPFRLTAFLEVHLSQCPESIQGHVPVGDVEAERAETSVPGILIQHYLLFSLSQILPLPSNQNNLQLFPFGKAACIVDVCQWLSSDTQSARKTLFTWGSRDECCLPFSCVWWDTLWMSLGLRAGVLWYGASLTPLPVEGQEELPAP